MDSFWTDDPSIASSSPSYGTYTWAEGLSGGQTSINGRYFWDQWDLVDGNGQCVESRGDSTDSQPVTVNDAKILRDGTDITGTTQNVIVGQQINLSLQALPGGTTATNVQWTVPGNPIAGFIATPTTGTVSSLGSLTNSSVTYYWVEGGDGYSLLYY
jgi:hypothetical protein